MGQGNLSLEDAVVVYERGVRLSQHCQKLLDKANKKIRELDKELMAVNPSSADENEVEPPQRVVRPGAARRNSSSMFPNESSNGDDTFSDADIPF